MAWLLFEEGTTPEGCDYTLEQTEDGWEVTDPSGEVHGFDAFGLLKTITVLSGRLSGDAFVRLKL